MMQLILLPYTEMPTMMALEILKILVFSCSTTVGYVTNDLDCIDSDDESNPDALEVCDNLDNDCDGEQDENFKLNGIYSSNDHCGLATMYVPQQDNLGRFVIPQRKHPFVMLCSNGYIDANSDFTDGCECIFVSENDFFLME